MLRKSCFHPFVLMIFVLLGKALGEIPTPQIVPTFHCLGIYWNPPAGAENMTCHVNYREISSGEWRIAQSLWFDPRTDATHVPMYRGSIVNLTPGTEYEIHLWLEDAGRTEAFLSVKTWDEQFPVNGTVYLPPVSFTTYQIDRSGSSDGYVLYQPAPGQNAVIDAKDQESFCVFLPESTHHVILRGLTLRGATKHAIRFADFCHDIIIEECDISHWGSIDSTGYGVNLNAAISAPYRADHLARIIIQRNQIHHPNANANSWGEMRPNPDGDPYHPQGPYGIVFYDTEGNHVIRYNRFFSDDAHYFCDILGAGSNIGNCGFPNRDTDIYGNYFECCWDDAIEAEGANENVRIWENTIDHCYHPIGAVVTSVGPLYIWRNIVNHTRKYGDIQNSDDYGRGEFIKCGGAFGEDGVWYGGGRMYVYHNTLLQPISPQGLLPLGCEGALVAEGKVLLNAITRNNIFTNYDSSRYTFRDNAEQMNRCGENDFDYDLYVGKIKQGCEEIVYETNGISLSSNDDIRYNPDDPAGAYALIRGTPGHDAGIVLPNFNDDFYGRAPDVGAIESRADSQSSVIFTHLSNRIRLYQNYPNPFNGATKIVFFLPTAANIALEIFAINGQLCATVAGGRHASGYHLYEWNATDDRGSSVPSGVYLCRLRGGGNLDWRKLMFVR